MTRSFFNRTCIGIATVLVLLGASIIAYAYWQDMILRSQRGTDVVRYDYERLSNEEYSKEFDRLAAIAGWGFLALLGSLPFYLIAFVERRLDRPHYEPRGRESFKRAVPRHHNRLR